MSVVVTGATGHLGRLVVEELLARGVPADQVLATGRDAGRLAEVGALGVRTAAVDHDDPSTLDGVLQPGDTVLLVSGSVPGARLDQHRAVIGAATLAGVGHLVYTSATRADDTDLVLAPEHAQTEEMLRASGLPVTVLRNNWYTENYAADLARAKDTGVLASGTGDGRVASATRRDYAAATAGVLADPAPHAGRTYELTGAVAWTYDDLAAAMAEVLGRDVTFHRLTPEEQTAALTGAGLDEGTAGFVVALDGNIAAGALDVVTDDLPRLAGRPATSLVDGLRPLAG
ncbi:SDR family oxidoreductase [Pseudokineococcus lusitanus]|uniref:NAD(P)H dehydrogenase (Quinone) n=1 Tax=Pseudokineococcus lusitanus TaxID=763993 RepID=A0A3N1HR29_9ACTN|nr:SDR family oxidoreductase [Pseudokineococcus lusitanus]ROP44951.1 NAD(P)H dehydrogenase (quinone) [Pseudokineococcus lusitanus]